MSKIKKGFIQRDLTSSGLSARDLLAGHTAINYTPANTAGESNSAISSHLKGIDTALASAGGGDTTGTATIAQNQTNSNITGLSFDGSLYRSIIVRASISRKTATVEKDETVEMKCTYNTLSNTWTIAVEGEGNAGVTYNITNAGQVTYSSDTLSGITYVGQIRFSYKTFAV